MSGHRYDMTTLALEVPEGWFDHSISSFQAPDFAQSAIVVVVKRGPLEATLEQLVEKEIAEERRSFRGWQLVEREAITYAAKPAHVVEARFEHPIGPLHQYSVYSSARPGRWYRMTISGRADHEARVRKLYESVLASARPVRGAS